MRIFTDKDTLSTQVNGRYIFVDNDFLSQLFEHEEVLKIFIELLPYSTLMIDPYVELEFRRDVYLPRQRILKEDFVNNPLFVPVPDHQEIYRQVKTNALLLSQVYSHQNEHGASIVDLILASRLMVSKYSSLIITGNRKDFPSCIFDNVAILNLENSKGTAQTFYLVEFNTTKFNQCYKAFKELKS